MHKLLKEEIERWKVSKSKVKVIILGEAPLSNDKYIYGNHAGNYLSGLKKYFGINPGIDPRPIFRDLGILALDVYGKSAPTSDFDKNPIGLFKPEVLDDIIEDLQKSQLIDENVVVVFRYKKLLIRRLIPTALKHFKILNSSLYKNERGVQLLSDEVIIEFELIFGKLKFNNMKLPKPLKAFNLTPKLDKISSSMWDGKSLYENIVNPITAKAFIERDDNFQEIQSILDSTELFESANFSRLYSKVDEIARRNNAYQNIEYEFIKMPDPFDDNFETLSIDGWRRHIFNIIYGLRSDPSHYQSWREEYVRWRKCYDIARSGSDPDGLCTDLYDLGF